jgi:hypothetical protein
MRQGPRFRARLSTKGPTAKSAAADLCNKIGQELTLADTPSQLDEGTVAQDHYFRRILSIAFPRANSSISLSK